MTIANRTDTDSIRSCRTENFLDASGAGVSAPAGTPGGEVLIGLDAARSCERGPRTRAPWDTLDAAARHKTTPLTHKGGFEPDQLPCAEIDPHCETPV
jgi:hypothetical protein